MRAYKVAIGYGENVQSVPEFQTVTTVDAETPEKAAEEIFNGLDSVESGGVILQVRDVITGEYSYFTF